MLQPFEAFSKEYLNRLIELGKIYLVSQRYTRIKQQEKAHILLTDYDDAGLALVHLNAIKQDEFAAIINLSKPAHLAKVKATLREDSAYFLWWSIVQSRADLEKLVNAEYKEKMQQFIAEKTNWRIARETTIVPSLEVTFGELFINLKHKTQKIRIKFEELEKL